MSTIAKGNFTFRGYKMSSYGLSIVGVGSPDDTSNFGVANEVIFNQDGQVIDSKEQYFETTIEMAFKSKSSEPMIEQVNRILFGSDKLEPLVNEKGLIAYIKFTDGQIVYKNNLTYITAKAICMPYLYTPILINNVVNNIEDVYTFDVSNVGITECYANISITPKDDGDIILSNNVATITLRDAKAGQSIEIYGETNEIIGIDYNNVEVQGNICKLIYGKNTYTLKGKGSVDIAWQCKMGRM